MLPELMPGIVCENAGSGKMERKFWITPKATIFPPEPNCLVKAALDAYVTLIELAI